MNALIRDIEVSLDGVTEIVQGERRLDNIYYCLESTVLIEIRIYGSEIEVAEIDNKLKYVKISKESDFVTYGYIRSKTLLKSDKGEKIKEEIMHLNGNWEQLFGGVFIIHLPKQNAYMLKEILQIDE